MLSVIDMRCIGKYASVISVFSVSSHSTEYLIPSMAGLWLRLVSFDEANDDTF